MTPTNLDFIAVIQVYLTGFQDRRVASRITRNFHNISIDSAQPLDLQIVEVNPPDVVTIE